MSMIASRASLNNAGIILPSVSRFQSLIFKRKIPDFFGRSTYYRHYSNFGTELRSSDFALSRLLNGIRVATKSIGECNKSNLITFGILIDGGSSKEDNGKNGVAHFLEHLMFKGTHKRPKKQIEYEIESMGAHLNAYTTREQTVYQIRCFINDMPRCMDILSDIIKNSKLCKKSIENEREVIIREMEEVNKSEEEAIFDDLHSEIYRGSKLGNTILGPKENIMNISRSDLVDYINENYTPNNMVILAIGNIDHDYFRKLVEHYFDGLTDKSKDKGGCKTSLKANEDNSTSCSSDKTPVVIQKRGEHDGKLYVSVGYNGVSFKSADLPKLMLLKIILGEYYYSNTNSFNKITDHLISHVKKYLNVFETFIACYKDTGILGWYLKFNDDVNTLSELEINRLTKLLHDKFKDLHMHINEEDLSRAKRILSYQIASVYEHSPSLFDEIGKDIIVNNRHVSVDERLDQLKSIKLDDIKDVINKYLNYDELKYIIKK